MNDLTTQSPSRFNGSPLRIELAKMLGLVAPISMSADQCTLWLASAEDALLDIRADEIAKVSMEVRRSVVRLSQIVPEIAKLVAELRSRNAKAREYAVLPPIPPPVERAPEPPLSEAEIAKMPKYLKDIGMRVGFLGNRNGRIVDTTA